MPPKVAKKWSEGRSRHRGQSRLTKTPSANCWTCAWYQDDRRGPGALHAPAGHRRPNKPGYASTHEWARSRRPLRETWRPPSVSWKAYAARFALLHQVVTNLPREGRRSELDGPGPSDPVSGAASMEAGIELARWFAAEADAASTPCWTRSTDHARNGGWSEYIRSRGGSIRPSELHRANQRKYPTAGHAEKVHGRPRYGWARAMAARDGRSSRGSARRRSSTCD